MLLSDLLKKGIRGVEKRFEELRIWNFDLVVVPLHLPLVGDKGHWALVTIDLVQKKISAYDPLHLPRGKELNAIYQLMVHLAGRDGEQMEACDWELQETAPESPAQQDAVSCGVYVCAVADVLMANLDMTRGVDENLWRRKIAAALRRGYLPGEEKWAHSEVDKQERELRYGKGRYGVEPPMKLTTVTDRGERQVVISAGDPVSFCEQRIHPGQPRFKTKETDVPPNGYIPDYGNTTDVAEEPMDVLKIDATPDPNIEEGVSDTVMEEREKEDVMPTPRRPTELRNRGRKRRPRDRWTCRVKQWTDEGVLIRCRRSRSDLQGTWYPHF